MQEELSSLETGISRIPSETAADGRCRKREEGSSRGRSWEDRQTRTRACSPKLGYGKGRGLEGNRHLLPALILADPPLRGQTGKMETETVGPPSSLVPSLNHILSLFSEALVSQPRDLYQPHLVYPHNRDEEAEHVVLLPTSFSKGPCVCQCQGAWGRGGQHLRTDPGLLVPWGL